jgi:RimJ/RimL family protein N-acetyltransferase
VVASTIAVNVASRRVMEKTGLTLERTFYQQFPDPIEGAEHGVVEYALRKTKWEQEAAGRKRLPLGGSGAQDAGA